MEMSVLDREYVRVRVDAYANGAKINPTADTVEMAFKAAGTDPTSGDWKTASWDTDNSGSSPIYHAQCLVGPGGTIALSAAAYIIWLRITDSPEQPVKRVGRLVVT